MKSSKIGKKLKFIGTVVMSMSSYSYFLFLYFDIFLIKIKAKNLKFDYNLL